MKGFALIEVLVALLIFSMGLLGIAGMQLSALKHSQEAYWHSVATTQLSSLLERLRANRSGSTRNKELYDWNLLNVRLLPQGEGVYQCISKTCTVSITWKTSKKHSLFLTSDI